MTAVSSEAGATLAELSATIGWLPHTTRAALCRLRQRGFAVNLAEHDGRKAYRLTTRS
jgi:DNA-binding transcriptional regulator PaaX